MGLTVIALLPSVQLSITSSARDVIPPQIALTACGRGNDEHIPDQPKCDHQSTSKRWKGCQTRTAQSATTFLG